MTLQIPLGNGKFATIDEIDADLADFKWHILSGRYAARKITINKKTPGRKRVYVYLHQIIFERKYGRKSSDQEVADHKDGKILNNTRKNIRPATRIESARNRSSHNASGFKGVYPSGRRWVARIGVNYESKYLGTFDTPEDAHQAYKNATIENGFGEFTREE